ncbi:Pectinesterase like protein [Verticillium longisporum]|nr:Pectinesterase like protein [Verticillium longisporum]
MKATVLSLLLLGLCRPSAAAAAAVTVASDGSGQFTNINSAIAYAQANAVPTVTVLAGTYTEAIAIQATAAVTIVGETASTGKTYSDNLVTITNGASGTTPPINFLTSTSKGVTWKNVNIANANAASTAGIAFLRGSKHAFYSCQLTAAGSIGFAGSHNSGLIANSYVQAADKIFSSFGSFYVYGSTITATNNNALVVYNKGFTDTASGKLYNSNVVFDTCQIIQKAGTTNKNVFLAAANGVGVAVIWRETSIPGFVANSGVYVDTNTQDARNTYIEYDTTGPGSYANKAAARAAYVTLATDVAKLAPYELSAFYTGLYPSVAVAGVDWVDAAVLSSIQRSPSGSATTSSVAPSSAAASSVAASSAAASSAAASSVAASSVAASSAAASSVAASSVAASSAAASVASSAASVNVVSSAASVSVASSAASVNPASSAASVNSNPSAAASVNSASSAASVSVASSAASVNAASSVAPSVNAASSVASSVNIASSVAASVNKVSSDATAAAAASTTSAVSVDSTTAAASTIDTSSAVSTTAAACAPSLAAAVAALPADTTTQHIYILAGTYNEKVTLTRTGATILRGETDNALSSSTNKVTIQNAAGVLSSAGGSAGTATFSANKYEAKFVTFYNINFENTFAQQTNNIAIAAYSKGTKVAFYGCNVKSTQGSLYLDYDFVWGIGAGYFYNSNSFGGSQIVFDGCAIVPKDKTVPQRGTYLGRDYSTNAQVAVVNSYLDAHIYAVGWRIGAPTTFIGTFAEANNTGPGAVTTARASVVKLLADNSAYTVKKVLGDDAWLDAPAIAPQQAWPDSVYAAPVVTTTSATTTSAPSGASSYATVASAVAALPADGKEYTIFIKAGSYEEQNAVHIKFSRGVSTSAGRNEETPVLNWKNTNGDGLALYNINFTNTYPQQPSTAALAGDFFGTNMAAYGCAFDGFQDTLLVNQGVQVFSNSYIEGSVDFIWGNSKAYFHQCYVASNTPRTYITAQNRPNAAWAGGFVFDKSVITYTESYGTNFGTVALGWSVWQTNNPQTDNVLFGEFNNIGPGNWTDSRATFATKLTEAQAYHYSLTGTEPPAGAVIVGAPGAITRRADGSTAETFNSLTAALASLPSDSSNQIIFLYPGTYTEQVPSINRPGPVTITQARGLSVSPPPAGHSNSETATIATASSKISCYVSLAASDTLLTGATAGNQYYESCYIDGAIDFIWGYSKAYFKGCTIAAKRAKSAITAQSRASLTAIGGYIFDQCLFTEAPTATVDLKGQVYLGRPYSKFALVVVKNSFLSDVIQPAGWKVWSNTDPRNDSITFAEYNNVGPGNWENNAAARATFRGASLLTADDYPLSKIQTPQPAVTTYDTIQAALNALPTSKQVTPTVFIYPGTSNSGDYTQNQVTISFDKGIDTQADASNSDSATVYATGNYLQAVNINFANTFGTASNYASLGFGVKSSKYASLYGCQVYGNQDALLINGFLFASHSYIEGNVDMIWGSGAAYFLASTIAPNRDGIALTASKRATDTTPAGFVFDQCTVTPAKGAKYTSVSLGRPWNANARVAYIDSFLDSCIEANGWDHWTKNDPRTAGAIFGEFANDGPGSDLSARAAFATKLTAADAAQFELATFFPAGISWINMTLVSATPFKAGAVVLPSATISATSATTTTTTTTSTSTTSSVPATTVTVFTTKLSTLKETTSTTVQALDTTVTLKTTATFDAATTITPAVETKTTLIRSTEINVATVQEPDTTIVRKATITVNVGTTVTPNPVTQTSTSLATSTNTIIVTKTAEPRTITSTTLTTSTATSTPKGVTTTQVIRSTAFFTQTTTRKPVTVKSTSTIVIGDGSVTTVTAKALTVSTTVFKTVVSRAKKTTTIKCIPTKAPTKRDLFEFEDFSKRDDFEDYESDPEVAYVEVRALGDVTVTVTVLSTLSTYVKTATVTLPGSTSTTELVTTKTVGKPVTLKAVTATQTIVTVQTRATTTTLPARTLKITATAVSTRTVTVQSTTTLPAAIQNVTATVTVRENSAQTNTVILPASTATRWTTVRSTVKPSGTITNRATVTKTKTSEVKSTVTSWVTKTSKGAKTCTA